MFTNKKPTFVVHGSLLPLRRVVEHDAVHGPSQALAVPHRHYVAQQLVAGQRYQPGHHSRMLSLFRGIFYSSSILNKIPLIHTISKNSFTNLITELKVSYLNFILLSLRVCRGFRFLKISINSNQYYPVRNFRSALKVILSFKTSIDFQFSFC